MSNVFQVAGQATQTNREEAVLWYNPNLFGWEPRYGVPITQSDISKSEVLQEIVSAMTTAEGEKDLSPATFEGLSGSFRWNERAVKAAPEGLVIKRVG